MPKHAELEEIRDAAEREIRGDGRQIHLPAHVVLSLVRAALDVSEAQ